MFSAPGPVSSMTFVNSSSVQLFGRLPINNRRLVSASEHLNVLPCNDANKKSQTKLTSQTHRNKPPLRP